MTSKIAGPGILPASTGRDASALLDSLRRAIEARDPREALRLCNERLATDPSDAEAHRCLGVLYAALEDPGRAVRHGLRACELLPDDPRAWSDLGRVHALLGQLEDAIRCFEEALRVDVGHADAWHNLGAALERLGRRRPAFEAFKTALRIDGTRADTYLAVGSMLVAAEQLEDALECFERAVRHDPTLPRARSRLAAQVSQGGKVERAETLFRESLGMDPEHIEGWLGLGRALEDLGQAAGARSAYLNVLRRRPDHAAALGQYLSLLRDSGPREGRSPDDEEAYWIERARAALVDDAARDEARALIGYGLAKYHDRRREVAQAAHAGLQANAARRRVAGPLDRELLRERIDRLIAAYPRDFFFERRHLGVGSAQPVFIVGLPRSGTTLTEQVLAAHPQMHGAGELPTLARLASTVSGEPGAGWQAASRIDDVQSRVLAGRYLEALRDGAPRGLLRYSDKAPLNFFHLAFAALLFPQARVVHCHRGARDNALSIWMENFNVDQRYATDFDDLAFHRGQYERLMAHWKEALPLPILGLEYEATVADLEGQARRLIDFLGAPWDPACLDFHRQDRAVQTPSRWQVRQPIYTHSVERWRPYAEHLPPLVRAFQAWDAPEEGG